MTHATTRAFHPRALTSKERWFTRWFIEHANVSEEEKKKYLGRLAGFSFATVFTDAFHLRQKT